MTASSSALWIRFSPPSDLINGHMSTVWFMVCCWPQSQEGDWARPHLCTLAWRGLWPVWKQFIIDRAWQGRWKPGCRWCWCTMLNFSEALKQFPALLVTCMDLRGSWSWICYFDHLSTPVEAQWTDFHWIWCIDLCHCYIQLWQSAEECAFCKGFLEHRAGAALPFVVCIQLVETGMVVIFNHMELHNYYNNNDRLTVFDPGQPG